MLSWSIAAHRWRSLLGTLLSLASGVALLSATAVVIASATAQPPARYAEAAVLVSAPQAGEDSSGFPEFRPWSGREADRLAGELAGLDGVRAAVAHRAFPAQVIVDGRLLHAAEPDDPQGHNWSSAVLAGSRIVDGVAPSGPGDIAVPAASGLRPGDTLDLLTATGRSRVTVTATVGGGGSGGGDTREPVAGGPPGGRSGAPVGTVYVADAVADESASGSRVVGLVLEPGADARRVAAAAQAVVGDRGAVHAGTDRARLESEADAIDRWVGAQLLGVMGVLSGFVSVFVVATTSAFSVLQRRREIGLLRAVGATPGQVRRMLLGEAVLVGLCGSAAGALLGAALAPVLGRWMVAAGMQAASWEPRTVALPVAGSVLAGLGVALLGVWSASRRAARIRPLEALRESAVERRPMTTPRRSAGLAGVAAGVLLAALTPAAASGTAATVAALAVAVTIGGLTLLAPAYVPWVVRGLCRPFRSGRGATVELVREGSVAGARRVAAVTGPVLVTVGFAVLVLGLVETMDGAVSAGSAADVPAETVIVPQEGVPGLSDAALDAVAGARPRRLLAVLPTGVVAGGRWMDAAGLDGVSLAGLSAAVRAGDLSGLLPPGGDGRTAAEPGGGSPGPAGGSPAAPEAHHPAVAVAVAEAAAAANGWRPGDEIPVAWADGTAGRARVAAVVADGAAPAPILLTRAAARAHDPAALTPVAYVDGVDVAALDARLREFAAGAVQASGHVAAGAEEEERVVRLFVVVLLGLALGFTALAIANTLVMATGDRRRDFAVLRLSGAGVGQVLAVVAAEAVLVVVIGALLGILVALPGLFGIASGLADDFGVDVAVRLPWPRVLTVVAACGVIALVASVLPARLGMRGPPAPLAGDRE